MQRHSHKLLMAVLAVLLVLAASEAVAGGHPHHGYHGGYHYGHYRGYGYPAYGYSAHYHGSPYYYGGGAWYRPYGARFVVVAPPIGIGVNLLPPFYTTLWFGGAPYYYANDTHYHYQYHAARREYVVTEPPRGQAPAAPVADSAELYAYPRNGQSEERQSVDRDDCHRWAVVKVGFDPAKSVGAHHDLSSFRRAEGACLDARGYSVK
jgi:hypothetical protein